MSSPRTPPPTLRANGSYSEGRSRSRSRERVSAKPPELHSIHEGRVRSVRDFGAFIRLPGYDRDGLVHISQVWGPTARPCTHRLPCAAQRIGLRGAHRCETHG